MNVTCTTSIKRRILVPMLAIASSLASLNLYGAILTITGITHEQVGYRGECATHFGGTSTGMAVSSLLGFVSIAGNDCITPLHGYFSFEGELTFTTTHGDELFADYSGLFTPTAYPPLFALTDSIFEITGGTGSFAKATGGGILQGGQNILTGLGLMQASGEIFDFRTPKGKIHRHSGLIFGDNPVALPVLAGLDNDTFPDLPVLGGYYHSAENLPDPLPQGEVPEPGILALLGIGLAGLWAHRKRMN